jgi:hypothetical protein
MNTSLNYYKKFLMKFINKYLHSLKKLGKICESTLRQIWIQSNDYKTKLFCSILMFIVYS